MELQIRGSLYATSQRLPTFTQLTLARKLAPAIPVLSGLFDKKNEDKDRSLLALLAFAKVPDEDAQYVTNTTLAVVTRQEPGQPPAPIQAGTGLMFQDITMSDVLTIVVSVIEENLGDFFRIALDNLVVEAAKS